VIDREYNDLTDQFQLSQRFCEIMTMDQQAAVDRERVCRAFLSSLLKLDLWKYSE
jgi:hypothetical protein